MTVQTTAVAAAYRNELSTSEPKPSAVKVLT